MKSAKEDSSIQKNEVDERSHNKRGATSHNKYGFHDQFGLFCHLYMDLFALYFGQFHVLQHIIFGTSHIYF